eukprot:SAG11_NODE_1793_length_4252_cov_6.530701_3_plen_57_part_00
MLFSGQNVVFLTMNLATTQYCTKFSITVELPATNFTLVGGTLMMMMMMMMMMGISI